MDHVVGARNSRDLNASAHRCIMYTDCERRLDLIWERWQASAGHIELDAIQLMLSHSIEHFLQPRTRKHPGENSQSHHTPPVTSANAIKAPLTTEREIASSVRKAATPS